MKYNETKNRVVNGLFWLVFLFIGLLLGRSIGYKQGKVDGFNAGYTDGVKSEIILRFPNEK